jgi:pimeloyl-ACP methyl ester carboxylesterase
MKKPAKIASLVALVLLALAGAAWVFVAPRELKTLVRFWMWHDSHLRASGDVALQPAGTRVYWEEFGAEDGPAVVVLHGGLCAIPFMGGQIEPLAAEKFRVIALETRGHGKSSNTAPAFSYELLADDVVAVLDALKVPRADIVGWSDGGNTALELARRYPERIRSIVAIGANRSPDGLKRAELQQFLAAAPTDPMLAPLRTLYERRSKSPQEWPKLLDLVRGMAASQPKWSLEELGAIRAPVLLINGEHDLTLPAHAAEMQKAIPGARLEIAAGEGHSVPLSNPQLIAPTMMAFLRAQSAQR